MKKHCILLYLLVLTANCAFAQNETGSFTDTRDGQVYTTVQIGDHWWMSQNLNFATENSWWYDEKKENGDIYGRLYTYADAKKACPVGWHLPSDDEWKQLEQSLGLAENETWKKGWRGDTSNVGLKLRANSPLWASGTNTGAASGFNALPAGYRKHSIVLFSIHKISFNNAGTHTGFWTSTKAGGSNAYYRYLDHTKNSIFRYRYFDKAGFSVRCVQNAEE